MLAKPIGSLSIKGLSMFESFTVSNRSTTSLPLREFSSQILMAGVGLLCIKNNEDGLAPVDHSDKELQAQVHELQVFRGVWV